MVIDITFLLLPELLQYLDLLVLSSTLLLQAAVVVVLVLVEAVVLVDLELHPDLQYLLVLIQYLSGKGVLVVLNQEVHHITEIMVEILLLDLYPQMVVEEELVFILVADMQDLMVDLVVVAEEADLLIMA
jgi:hypothetical protein